MDSVITPALTPVLTPALTPVVIVVTSQPQVNPMNQMNQMSQIDPAPMKIEEYEIVPAEDRKASSSSVSASASSLTSSSAIALAPSDDDSHIVTSTDDLHIVLPSSQGEEKERQQGEGHSPVMEDVKATNEVEGQTSMGTTMESSATREETTLRVIILKACKTNEKIADEVIASLAEQELSDLSDLTHMTLAELNATLNAAKITPPPRKAAVRAALTPFVTQ